MATRTWKGSSLNRRQVDRIELTDTGDWAAGHTIVLTIDNIDFTVTVGSLITDDQVATTLYQAISGTTFTDTTASATVRPADGGANSIPQFSEFTATVSSNVVTLTSNGTGALAGKPWTLTVSESGTGASAAESTTTTAVSQYHASEVDNWSGATAPADNDTLIFDSGAIDVRWGLNTYASGSTTCQPASIVKYKSYTGNVGLPYYNTDNSAKPYAEYRTPRYFTTDNNSVTTTADLEVGEGQGSGRFMWDAGAGQVALNIYGRGTRIENGVPCILFLGSHASNTVRNLEGDLGIAFFGGETATISSLTTGGGPTSAASTICGSGCTLTTVTLNGGSQETNSAITTARQYGGTWVHKSGTVTTANIYGGTHYPNGAATYTTLNLYGGTFDASKGNAAMEVSNTIQMYKGSKFIDPQGRVGRSGSAGNIAFKLNGCDLADVTIILPDNKTFTLSD